MSRPINDGLTNVQRYYRRHRARRVAEASVRAERNRTLLREAKSRPCADCGETYPYYVMDLDHVRGEKDRGVGTMLTYSEARFRSELAKCEVRCSNCHRLRHGGAA